MKNKSKYLSIALASLLCFTACQTDKTSTNEPEEENQESNTEKQQTSNTMIYDHPITITQSNKEILISGALETSEEGFAIKSIETFAAKNKNEKTFNVLFIHYAHPEGAINAQERTHKIKVLLNFKEDENSWDLSNKTVLAWYYNDNAETVAQEKEQLTDLIKKSQLDVEGFLEEENSKPQPRVPKQSEGGILGIASTP